MNKETEYYSRALMEVLQALRVMHDAVGVEILPAVDGSSWYEIMKKYDPIYAAVQKIRTDDLEPEETVSVDYPNAQSSELNFDGVEVDKSVFAGYGMTMEQGLANLRTNFPVSENQRVES